MSVEQENQDASPELASLFHQDIQSPYDRDKLMTSPSPMDLDDEYRVMYSPMIIPASSEDYCGLAGPTHENYGNDTPHDVEYKDISLKISQSSAQLGARTDRYDSWQRMLEQEYNPPTPPTPRPPNPPPDSIDPSLLSKHTNSQADNIPPCTPITEYRSAVPVTDTVTYQSSSFPQTAPSPTYSLNLTPSQSISAPNSTAHTLPSLPSPPSASPATDLPQRRRPCNPTPAQRDPKNGPHKSEYCGRTFKQRGLLTKHNLQHTRPVKCDLCDWTFPHQCDLNRHFKDRHLGLRLKCDICSAETRCEWNLKKHKRDTHGLECKKTRIFKDAKGVQRGVKKQRQRQRQKKKIVGAEAGEE